MKTKALIAAGLIALSSVAMADPGRHYDGRHEGGRGYGGNGWWIAPLIIGGIAGAVIESNRQPAPVYVAPYQYPAQPEPVYRQVVVFDVNCGCYVKTWQQVGWK